MRKSRFTEAQIIGMIKEQEAGLPTSELCRKHGLSPATFYKLKAKYGGMDLSDAKRLKQLEDENAKLKRLACVLIGVDPKTVRRARPPDRAIAAPLVRAQWRGRKSVRRCTGSPRSAVASGIGAWASCWSAKA